MTQINDFVLNLSATSQSALSRFYTNSIESMSTVTIYPPAEANFQIGGRLLLYLLPHHASGRVSHYTSPQRHLTDFKKRLKPFLLSHMWLRMLTCCFAQMRLFLAHQPSHSIASFVMNN